MDEPKSLEPTLAKLLDYVQHIEHVQQMVERIAIPHRKRTPDTLVRQAREVSKYYGMGADFFLLDADDRPTESGWRVYHWAKRLLEEHYYGATKLFSGPRSATIRIGTYNWLLRTELTRCLARFDEQVWPKYRSQAAALLGLPPVINYTFKECDYDEMMHELVRGEVEIGIGAAPVEEDPETVERVIYKTGIGTKLLVNKDARPLRIQLPQNGEAIELESLASASVITVELEPSRARYMLPQPRDGGRRILCTNYSSLFALVAHNLGVGLVPDYLLAELPKGVVAYAVRAEPSFPERRLALWRRTVVVAGEKRIKRLPEPAEVFTELVLGTELYASRVKQNLA